ncbi:MAG: type II secretion system F family protein [Actinobacteria bacterium]|nr:type II secretion system F family protein [Actinomycetota bacterium]
MSIFICLLGATGALLLFQGLIDDGSAPLTKDPIADQLDAAGLGAFRTSRFLGMSLFFGLISMLLMAGLTSSIALAGLSASAAAFSPWVYIRARAHKRAALMQDEWPDAIAALVAAVRSGSSLPEAMVAAGARAGPYLRGSFDRFTRVYRSSGSFTAAMIAFEQEAADPVADRLSAVLAMTHEVGGTDLVRVLRTLGDFVRADLNVRKEIVARWSWTVSAVRLAASAPWLVLAMMSIQPEAARAYASSGGAVVIAAGAVATGMGYRLMLRAARLPQQRRLNG